MAKKQKAPEPIVEEQEPQEEEFGDIEESDAEAEAEEEPVEAAVDSTNPDECVGLDHARDGNYQYVKADNKYRQRTHVIHGKTFEHVDTDANGVWLYRHHV